MPSVLPLQPLRRTHCGDEPYRAERLLRRLRSRPEDAPRARHDHRRGREPDGHQAGDEHGRRALQRAPGAGTTVRPARRVRPRHRLDRDRSRHAGHRGECARRAPPRQAPLPRAGLPRRLAHRLHRGALEARRRSRRRRHRALQALGREARRHGRLRGRARGAAQTAQSLGRTDDASAPGPLSDVRILDLTQALAGPFGTALLADLGADVIKVEPPRRRHVAADGAAAEGLRAAGIEPHGGLRLRRLLREHQPQQALDRARSAKRTTDRDRFLDLAVTADAVSRTRASASWTGSASATRCCSGVNPRLVYAAIRGFGDPRTGESPYAEWPAFDIVAQCMGGLVGITGPTEQTGVSERRERRRHLPRRADGARRRLRGARRAAHRQGSVPRRGDVRRHPQPLRDDRHQLFVRRPRARSTRLRVIRRSVRSTSTRRATGPWRSPRRPTITGKRSASIIGRPDLVDGRAHQGQPASLREPRLRDRDHHHLDARAHQEGGRSAARRQGAGRAGQHRGRRLRRPARVAPQDARRGRAAGRQRHDHARRHADQADRHAGGHLSPPAAPRRAHRGDPRRDRQERSPARHAPRRGGRGRKRETAASRKETT